MLQKTAVQFYYAKKQNHSRNYVNYIFLLCAVNNALGILINTKKWLKEIF